MTWQDFAKALVAIHLIVLEFFLFGHDVKPSRGDIKYSRIGSFSRIWNAVTILCMYYLTISLGNLGFSLLP